MIPKTKDFAFLLYNEKSLLFFVVIYILYKKQFFSFLFKMPSYFLHKIKAGTTYCSHKTSLVSDAGLLRVFKERYIQTP